MDSQTEICEPVQKIRRQDLYREDYFKEEITSTLTYFKLRKIMKLIAENRHDMEKAVNHQQFY